MAEFVEGWLVAQVLGEGAYGEVRLLVHARSGAAVALKVCRGGGGGGGGGEGAREAALQRALRHPHVLRCLGERTHLQHHYMFLEYAQGGELFDRIEPDVGMPEGAARRYWRQTLAGLEYLHARGVAHRDIKPENLLLDHRDDIKISDFGMATVFRHGARERMLSRVCGTLPYAAPEVLRAPSHPYRAPPADLWAAALVLLAMLAGELPWERAAEDDVRFAAWCEGGGGAVAHGPWRKVSRGARALLRAALRPAAAARPSLAALLSHAWTQDDCTEWSSREWRSQPAAVVADARPLSPDLTLADMDALLTHSQPARDSDLLLASQPGPGAAAVAAVAARLVRRLTRVWLRCEEAAALRALCDALQTRGHTWRRLHPRLLAVECGEEVRMRAWVVRCHEGEARSLLEFRRSRGCGLQFKRRFLELRTALSPLSCSPPPHAELLAAPLAEPLLSTDGQHCT